jgi:hypothetical protein
MTHYFVFLH